MTLFLPLLLTLTQPEDLPYAKEIAEFKRQDAAAPPAKGQIVFIGSSSFTNWTKVGDAFPGRKILNRAFGGSRLLDVTARLNDVVFTYEPAQVVLYCGENDFASEESLEPSVFVERFKDLYGKIRKRLPNSGFVYVSMKPSPSRWHLAPKFRTANRSIQSLLAKEKRTAFVDVWPAMLGADGKPKKEIFVEDMLHMNDEGYKLWIPLLDKVLMQRVKGK
ncbi:MAG: hypothetical protein K1X67_02970 [Fimbriimonadaceae bacterium]|nr:hypothetical protein [Fimbriimonadaceae bacterium]